jgi:hypothetical protein
MEEPKMNDHWLVIATPYPASQLPTTVDNRGEKIGRMKL